MDSSSSRSLLRLYVERRQNRLGSKIKTKLVLGALALSIVPVVCLVLFSFTILNRTLNKWFEQPTVEIQKNSEELVSRLNEIMKQKIETDAGWLASMPEVAATLGGEGAETLSPERLSELASSVNAHYVALLRADETKPLLEYRSGDLIRGPGGVASGSRRRPRFRTGRRHFPDSTRLHFRRCAGPPARRSARPCRRRVAHPPRPSRQGAADMEKQVRHYATLQQDHREYRYLDSGILALISVFVLFVATWAGAFPLETNHRPHRGSGRGD